MKISRSQRGSALLTTLILMGVLLGLLIGLISYVSIQRNKAINYARSAYRLSCAESGLQMARAFFTRRYLSWNTYLNNPALFNPVQVNAFNPTPPNIALGGALQISNPELFVDLDGDNRADAYIYIRDNQDELAPALPNWGRDNDNTVIAGALCVSVTMTPRLETGQADPTQLQTESLLSFNPQAANCSQSLCGNGTGNVNASLTN